MSGRDIMKGRHAVGGRTANPGKMRKGGSEPASNRFKTNAQPQYSKKAPLVPDAKETSANAQTMIQEAPTPFKNKMTTPNMPSGTGPKGAVPGSGVRGPYAGKSGSSVGQSNPGGAATGYSKLPNQSFQIGGRTSVGSNPRKAGVNGSGYPSKRNARFYGE